jgi:soluble lytic murein transglycosylase-like protein
MAAAYGAQYGGEAGVPPEFILALIKAESNGNPRAVGDAGHSVGLFQLHDRGVGYGYTVEQRYDPALQFQLMMPRIAAAYNAGVAKGLSGRQLAMFVGQQAERPAAAAVPRYGVAYDQITGGKR